MASIVKSTALRQVCSAATKRSFSTKLTPSFPAVSKTSTTALSQRAINSAFVRNALPGSMRVAAFHASRRQAILPPLPRKLKLPVGLKHFANTCIQRSSKEPVCPHFKSLEAILCHPWLYTNCTQTTMRQLSHPQAPHTVPTTGHLSVYSPSASFLSQSPHSWLVRWILWQMLFSVPPFSFTRILASNPGLLITHPRSESQRQGHFWIGHLGARQFCVVLDCMSLRQTT